jgi:hypothetical protein
MKFQHHEILKSQLLLVTSMSYVYTQLPHVSVQSLCMYVCMLCPTSVVQSFHTMPLQICSWKRGNLAWFLLQAGLEQCLKVRGYKMRLRSQLLTLTVHRQNKYESGHISESPVIETEGIGNIPSLNTALS